MSNVVGLDTGLTLIDPTSGVCRTGPAGFSLGHTYLDRLSRWQLLTPLTHFDCLAIDAPVLPTGVLHYRPRLVERLLMSGAFQSRCKPGSTHVRGTGQALRRAGCEAARQFAAECASTTEVRYPRVQFGQNVIEAFPNAFLGVLLPDTVIDETAAARGEKTAAFFNLAVRNGAIRALEGLLNWPDPAFWAAFPSTTHRDELAALVCAATAVGATSNRYVAVGEPDGGFIFLPPWELWQSWAKQSLDQLRQRTDFQAVRVWIDGHEFGPDRPLPT